jgi:peptide/nickel transport system substrate-binding protein
MSRAAVESRRPLLLVALLALAVLAAGGALALRVSGKDSVVLPVGSTYVEGVAGTWQRVNPLFVTANEVDQDLSQLIFSGLVRLGPDGLVQPDLADLPELSEDGKVYTFRLRKNLKWHDGQPLTSDDVAFTISRVTSADFRGDASLAEAWAGVEVTTPNSSTVVLRLKQASAPFLARYATLGIVPQHLLASLAPGALWDAPFNAMPVGSGPYRVQSLDSREAVLVANPDYYSGRPAFDTVKLRFYTDYPSVIHALQEGEVNGVLVREFLSEGELAQLRAIRGVSVEQPQRAAYIALYLNNDQALFQDQRVRQALSLAIDRAALVQRVLGGNATPSASAIPPGTWAYAPEWDVVKPNLEQARKLLEDAGWHPHPTTGVLAREGTEFRFTIRTDSDPQRVAVASELAHELEALGIRATVASTTFSVLRRDFLQERKYDAAVAGWDQGADPDPYFGWHSSQLGAAGLNLANFANPVVDELIARGRTRNDLDVRKDAYRQFQEKWAELTPSLVIAYPRYLYARTVAGKSAVAPVLVTPSQRFGDIARWKP